MDKGSKIALGLFALGMLAEAEREEQEEEVQDLYDEGYLPEDYYEYKMGL